MAGDDDFSDIKDALDGELAKANLLRVRGDYDQARSQCLSILKRYPNSYEAHILMGDIQSDQSQFEQAVEWYELAFDISEGSNTDRQKLENAQRSISQIQAKQTEEQLGLPPSNTSTPLMAVMVVVLIAVFATIAFFVGKQTHSQAPVSVRQSFDKPIVASPQPKTEASDSGQATPQVSSTDQATVTSKGASEDSEALSSLTKASSLGQRITSLVRDPRSGQFAITATAKEGEDERHLAAQIGKDAVDSLSDCLTATVRIVRADILVYVADIQRAKVQTVETSTWTEQHKDNADAWIPEILSHEWPTRATNTTTGDNIPTTPSQPTGTAGP